MNCKQGDLAFIVNSTQHPEVNGMIVRVIRRIIPGEALRLSNGKGVRVRFDRTADWLIESEGSLLPYFSDRDGRLEKHYVTQRPFGDRYLRPIRGSDAPDETLVWAGKPEQVTV